MVSGIGGFPMHPTNDQTPHRARPSGIERKGWGACAEWEPLRLWARDPATLRILDRRNDWPAIREAIHIEDISSALLGPPLKRSGDRLLGDAPGMTTMSHP